MSQLDIVLVGVAASLASGAMTAVGAAPLAFLRHQPRMGMEPMLGFAAGVMLAASIFSLILPALDRLSHMPEPAAVAIVSAALMGGALAIWSLDSWVPHEHFIIGLEGRCPGELRRVWLFVIAITLHNLPEGMAVGVGFGGGDMVNGSALAIGIGVQNVPEGFAVGAALMAEGYPRRTALAVAAGTGMAEPVAGLIGVSAFGISAALLPIGLALAAGAMLYVISHEVIPETHRKGTRCRQLRSHARLLRDAAAGCRPCRLSRRFTGA